MNDLANTTVLCTEVMSTVQTQCTSVSESELEKCEKNVSPEIVNSEKRKNGTINNAECKCKQTDKMGNGRLDKSKSGVWKRCVRKTNLIG